MDFDGTNMTGRVNGGPSDVFGLFGSSDKPIDRLLFRAGGGGTLFYLDDIKITTTASVLVQSLQPSS